MSNDIQAMEEDNDKGEAAAVVLVENRKNLVQKFDEKRKNWINLNDLDSINQYIQKEGPKDLRHFTINEYMGRGSESLVFKIRMNKTNKYFGLKIIKKKNNKTNRNEFYISKKLRHKNIATVLACYGDPSNDVDYILMELGHSNLSHFAKMVIKRNTLSETFLCLICYQVLQGLSYLHKNKIAHLDVKPQNILITEYLDIKLIDFSISLDYSNFKKEEEITPPYAGTPFFIAPEILKGAKIKIKDLQKVDLFSLGVTLYILGFGQLPFNINSEDNDQQMLYKLKSGWKVVDHNNIFSSHFIDFLNGLLQVNIGERLTINQALKSYWIKGAEIIMNEKENTYNANTFLSYLITDHIREFQEYIYKKIVL